MPGPTVDQDPALVATDPAASTPGALPPRPRAVADTAGWPTPDVVEVLDALVAENLPRLIGPATATAAARWGALRDQVLEVADVELLPALADPALQVAVIRAAEVAATNVDPTVARVLVNLLAERAAEPPTGLRARSLERAIVAMAGLTVREVAALSIAFAFRYVRFGVPTLHWLVSCYREGLGFTLDHLPVDELSLRQVEAMGCGTADDTPYELTRVLSEYPIELNARRLTNDVVVDALVRCDPGLAPVIEAYDLRLKQLALSPVGLAVAHAGLVSAGGFNAPLSVWVG